MPTDYTQELEVLGTALAAPGPIFDVDSKRANAEQLRERSAATDLWNDPDAARALMSELARIDDDLALHDRLAPKLDDLKVLNDLAQTEDDASVEAEIREGVDAMRSELDELDVLTLLSGEYDERDAIVSIHPGAGGTESQDWAEMLLRMILRWAERRGFESELDRGAGRGRGRDQERDRDRERPVRRTAC